MMLLEYHFYRHDTVFLVNNIMMLMKKDVMRYLHSVLFPDCVSVHWCFTFLKDLSEIICLQLSCVYAERIARTFCILLIYISSI